MKNRFQSLPFKCNLQRYNEAETSALLGAGYERKPNTLTKAGLYTVGLRRLKRS